jgi:heme exporter protein D
MTRRLIVAAAVLVSAYVHLHLWLDGMRHIDVVGPAFLVNTVAGVVIAGLLVTWKSWVAPLLAAGFGLSTLGAFTIATTGLGLFGDHEKWQGPYVWVAAAAELVALVVGLSAVVAERRTAPQTAASTGRRAQQTAP